ncbi:oligosaccharide flippase family protein [Photobacterium phosphoreum]|uniref:oligosaccharide flippase family protein n=1 Tax=Photobacterium phosphoreum TaxID=659 RepID=UPI0007F8BAF5|nr:oligosaccharide flippase family protein [Photobacterium phosphoreum]OBU32391.1 polysaccharide biosynthesis protein [Photobacterium phosphoreum]PSW33275.1 polysaccharide biosynthesis protein [Photobacterium phosphoreum]
MSFFKGASVYLVSNLLNAVIPFLLLPILTRYLSPAEYGQIAIFQTLLAGIGTFIGLNAIGAANRKFYDGDIDETILRQFNGSCIQILIVSSIIAFIGIFLFKNQLSEFLAIPTSWILAAAVISAFGFITSMRLGQWQIRSQAKWFGVLQVSSSLVNMLLSLLFVIVLTQGAQGRIDAQVITGILAAIIALLWLYKDKLLQIKVWKPQYIKEALSFGVPLIPHHVGFFLITAVDRFVINQKLGLTEAGIYMVAVQLSSAMGIVFDAINKAYIPWLFERLKRDEYDEKKQIVKYTYLFFVSVLIIAGIIFIIGPFFVTLIAGNQYIEAGKIIGLLCLGQTFGGMYLMVTNYIFYAKRTNLLSVVTIITGVINLCLLYLLVNKFGLVGAAIAFVIARFLQFMFTWVLANKCVEMKWI